MATKTITTYSSNYPDGYSKVNTGWKPVFTFTWDVSNETSSPSSITDCYISFHGAHQDGTAITYLAKRYDGAEVAGSFQTTGDRVVRFSTAHTALAGTISIQFETYRGLYGVATISDMKLYTVIEDSGSGPSSDLEPSEATIANTNVTAQSIIDGQTVVEGQPCRISFSNPNINDVTHSLVVEVRNDATGESRSYTPLQNVRYGLDVYLPEEWFTIFPNTSVTGGQVNYATVSNTGQMIGSWKSAGFALWLDTNSPTARPDAPGVSVTISTDNETIRGWNVPIQNYSYANLTITTPAAKYGTSIRFYEIYCPDFSQQITCAQPALGGTTQFQTPVFTTPGEYTIQVRAVDARGLRSEWQNYTVNVLTYTKPLISSCRIVRCERDGTESESGTHAKITCVASYSHVGPNYVRGVGAAYCVTGSNAFSSEVTLTANGDVYTGIIGIDPESTTDGLLNPSSSYDVRITINDMLVGAAFYYTLNTESFTFHMMDGGEGVAFGKASEKAGYLELAADWSIWMDKYNKDIVDLIVPIGSIKIFADNTDPNVLYGGTKWTKLKDRFLLGSGDTYTLGDTGGSAEIPAHTHGINYTLSPGGTKYWAYYLTQTDSVTASVTGDVTGGSDPPVSTNNLPPYLVVNIWKRIY